jgi:uncharacterized protein
MKYLLVLAVLVVAVWVWRNNRQSDANEAHRKPTKPKTPALPMNMVACLQCGTHLPESEALRGPQGHYCCPDHRQQHERTSA